MVKHVKVGKRFPKDADADDVMKRAPTEAEVRERAHQIWLAEGMAEGREVDNWMRARRELEREAGLE